MTAIQEIFSEFTEIKETQCKTLQDIMFFDAVLAIIESKYLPKEKQQILDAFNQGYREGERVGYDNGEDISTFEDADIYFNQTFNNEKK